MYEHCNALDQNPTSAVYATVYSTQYHIWPRGQKAPALPSLVTEGFIENSLKVMKTLVDFSVPGSPGIVLHCGAISMINN